MSTGMALAQTATPSPAPTASPNAPVVTQPGASPGNTASSASADSGGAGAQSHAASAGNMAPSSTAMTPDTQGAMSGGAGAATPAPDGAPSEAHVTAQGSSPGKTAPSSSTQSANMPAAPANTMVASEATPVHHRMMGVPAEGSAHMYLHLAKVAISHHDTARADDALSHAETRLLTRAIPASDASAVDQSPAITAIENARSALRSGDFAQASTYTATAMQAE
jgi:hypothetical protein